MPGQGAFAPVQLEGAATRRLVQVQEAKDLAQELTVEKWHNLTQRMLIVLCILVRCLKDACDIDIFCPCQVGEWQCLKKVSISGLSHYIDRKETDPAETCRSTVFMATKLQTHTKNTSQSITTLLFKYGQYISIEAYATCIFNTHQHSTCAAGDLATTLPLRSPSSPRPAYSTDQPPYRCPCFHCWTADGRFWQLFE